MTTRWTRHVRRMPLWARAELCRRLNRLYPDGLVATFDTLRFFTDDQLARALGLEVADG